MSQLNSWDYFSQYLQNIWLHGGFKGIMGRQKNPSKSEITMGLDLDGIDMRQTLFLWPAVKKNIIVAIFGTLHNKGMTYSEQIFGCLPTTLPKYYNGIT